MLPQTIYEILIGTHIIHYILSGSCACLKKKCGCCGIMGAEMLESANLVFFRYLGKTELNVFL